MMRQGCNLDGEFYSVYVEHEPVDLYCPESEGMTRQEFRDECDINVLMAGYERTGIISHVNPRTPMYADVSAVPDMALAIAIYESATKSFMSLPAAVRREFDNDPIKFVEFAQDRSNLPKLREWGLAAPEKPADAVAPSSGTSGASDASGS